MVSKLDIRKIRSLDGLHYSFEMLDYFYSHIYKQCCEINNDNSQIIGAMASCWGYIDALHRIREVAQSTPGINVKHLELRVFLESTAITEDFRHYIQHLRNELAQDKEKPSPVWAPFLG